MQHYHCTHKNPPHTMLLETGASESQISMPSYDPSPPGLPCSCLYVVICCSVLLKCWLIWSVSSLASRLGSSSRTFAIIWFNICTVICTPPTHYSTTVKRLWNCHPVVFHKLGLQSHYQWNILLTDVTNCISLTVIVFISPRLSLCWQWSTSKPNTTLTDEILCQR